MLRVSVDNPAVAPDLAVKLTFAVPTPPLNVYAAELSVLNVVVEAPVVVVNVVNPARVLPEYVTTVAATLNVFVPLARLTVFVDPLALNFVNPERVYEPYVVVEPITSGNAALKFAEVEPGISALKVVNPARVSVP